MKKIERKERNGYKLIQNYVREKKKKWLKLVHNYVREKRKKWKFFALLTFPFIISLSSPNL